MQISLSRATFMFSLAALVSGCGHLSATSQEVKPATVGKQRQMLNEGYSLLYKDAGNLDLAEFILYVKVESAAVDQIVHAAAEAGEKVKKDLEHIAATYPAVRIDLDPLPEMEKRKRAAISKDRARYFAPVVGHGGREYERTVLIGYANGFNHERHLCQAMAEAEPEESLKKFLLDAEQRYDGLYERVNAALEKDYFKDPNGKSKD